MNETQTNKNVSLEPPTYTATEWILKFKKVAGNNKQLLHDLECTGLIQIEDYQKLEKKLEYAIGYTANMLMEHNVSGAFIQNYEKQYGGNEWVNIAYIKELFEILAKPDVRESK